MLDHAVNGKPISAHLQRALNYIPALDGARALAILPVMAMHGAAPWAQGGYIGVDMFFILSGYLITTILAVEFMQSGAIRIGRFYAQRTLRLTPPLLAMLAVYLATAPWLWPNTPVSLEALLAAFYLSDYSKVLWSAPTVLAHTWSLSVEYHFYLLWPLVLPLVLRTRKPARVLFFAYLAATTWRIANQQWFGWESTYFRFDTRISGIILGSLIAVARVGSLPSFAGWIAMAVLTLLIALPTRWTPASLLMVVTIAELATAVLLLEVTRGHSRLGRLLAHDAPAYIGRLSYGLYLWHFPIMLWMSAQYDWVITLVVGVTLAFVFAAASHHTVEVSAQRWRVRLMKRTPATAA